MRYLTKKHYFPKFQFLQVYNITIKIKKIVALSGR